MRILDTTHKEIYNPIEDVIKHVITVHLEDEELFGFGISFEDDFKNLKANFIPKDINKLTIGYVE